MLTQPRGCGVTRGRVGDGGAQASLDRVAVASLWDAWVMAARWRRLNTWRQCEIAQLLNQLYYSIFYVKVNQMII